MSADVTATNLTLRERVGGRWAVSWIGFALWYPLSILFVFATVPQFQSSDMIVSGFIVATLAYLAAGVVMWLASVTVLRNRLATPAPVIFVVLVGGLSWGARSVVIGLSIESMDLPVTTSLISRFAYGFVLGAMILITSAYALDSVDRFRSVRQRLIHERVAELIYATRDEALTAALRLGVLEQVQGAMRAARVDLDKLDLSSETIPPEALAALDRVSEEGIRRVSRDTWVESQHIGHIRISELVGAAADRGFYRLWFPLLAAIFLAVPLARYFSWGTLAVLIVAVVYTSCVALASNFLLKRLTHGRMVIVGISMLFMAASGLLVDALSRWGIFATPLPLPALILIVVSAAVVYPLVSVAFAWQPASDDALLRLRSALRESDVQRANAAEHERRVRQDIAVMLHGSIGANFTATTMRMRHAIARGDLDSAREALQEARRLTDVDLSTWASIDIGDLASAVSAVVEPWTGLVTITTDVPADIHCSRAETEMITDVLTEGITNAVRHGHATRIELSVSPVEDGFDISVSSDGDNVIGDQQGLGSRLFNQMSAGRWELVPRDGGSGMDLRVFVALAPDTGH